VYEAAPQLLKALKKLYGCFDPKTGTLLIYPHNSQFEPVDDAHQARTILEAVHDAIVAADPDEEVIPVPWYDEKTGEPILRGTHDAMFGGECNCPKCDPDEPPGL
jgi:hypothetical protein